VFDLEPEHSPSRPLVRRLKQPVRQHPAFDAVMRSAPVLDIVAALIGSDVRYHSSKLNMKVADGGSPVEWHQDFAFQPHTNDDLCVCGIAIDDADEENGCLLVAPGSHRGPILEHHDADGQFVGAADPSLVPASVPVPLKAGAMSVHHTRLLHASGPNRSGRQRRLLLIQYGAADSFPLTYSPMINAPDFAEFDSRIVRGRGTTVARLGEALTVRLPRLAKGEYNSIFDQQRRLGRSAFSNQTKA
jgi:ectoine hydroxylase-related dioxygenase (phytanoyl-CoA dioxygenase family)